MFGRKTSGSVVCVSCGNLVAVNDETCYMCGRRNPGLWGYAPVLRRLGNDMGFVPLVVTGSIGLYVAALLASGDNIRMGGMMSFLSPSTLSLFLFGASGATPVFEYGRWWTVLSAGWLHSGVLHILFNMLWVRQLGPACAELYGPGRMVIIYILASVLGFVASSTAGELLSWMPIYFLRGAGFTVGASAGIFGLLGALVYYGRRSGSSMTSREALQYALMMGVFGLFMPGIDNWAHAGGFGGGYLIGRYLDPLKPERIDHIFIAVLLLMATVVSVAVSILHGFSLFRGGAG
jgi:rhomboid protease GluP